MLAMVRAIVTLNFDIQDKYGIDVTTDALTRITDPLLPASLISENKDH